MPNWCQNVLTIECCEEKQLEQFKAKLFLVNKDGNLYLDFNQLVPMPKALETTIATFDKDYTLLQRNPQERFSKELIRKYIPKERRKRLRKLANRHQWTIAQFIRWLEKRSKEQKRLRFNLSLAKQYANNIALYGAKDWYDWSRANWGCKWNVHPAHSDVYFEEDGSICCTFETPWNPPEEWFRTLCQTFPDYHMRLAYFEPGGWFAGELISDGDGEGGYSYNAAETDESIRELALREFGWNYYEDDEIDA